MASPSETVSDLRDLEQLLIPTGEHDEPPLVQTGDGVHGQHLAQNNDDDPTGCCPIALLFRRGSRHTANNEEDSEGEDNNGEHRMSLTDAAFELLAELEGQSSTFNKEHASLSKEVREHFRDSASIFGIATAVGLTGSIGVGIISCGVAASIAGCVGVVVLGTVVPLFFQAWVRLLGSCAKLAPVRDRQENLLRRLLDISKHYQTCRDQTTRAPPAHRLDTHPASPSMTGGRLNPSRSAQIPGADIESVDDTQIPESLPLAARLPDSPPPVTRVDLFRSRLRSIIGVTRYDVYDCQHIYFVYLTCMTIFGVLYPGIVASILYHGLCTDEES